MLMAGIFISTGCSHNPDPRLLQAENIMEEHPNLSLKILQEIELPDDATEYDRRLYDLLMSHAKYKNFIDEDNDSLLLSTAKYFLDKDNAEEASKALFLAGMIQLNCEKLGRAAVSLKNGLDIARKNECYMWEGQCARGLFELYGKLLDSSAQLQYSKESYEAFLRGGYSEWANWSRVEIASALNNAGRYEESYEMAKDISEKSQEVADLLLYEESVHLMSLCSFNSGDYRKAVANYIEVFKINPERLTAADKINFSIAVSHINTDSIAPYAKSCISHIVNDNTDTSFVVLADKGKYKEAYERLYQYKNMQDSVFVLIQSNNVSTSLDSYEMSMIRNIEDKHRRTLLFTHVIILLIILFAIVIYMSFKVSLLRSEQLKEKYISDIETLKKDLQIQIEKNISVKKYTEIDELEDKFIQRIRENYSEANLVCDEYYQNPGLAKGKLSSEVERIFRDFTNPESLNEIGQYVDSLSDNLYSDFKKEMYNVNEDGRRLFLYLLVGFSNRSISILLRQNIGAIYTKKSRLKERILKSNASRKDEYITVFK